MKNKPDHSLDEWLSHYKVADVDPMLLDRIVAVATVMPQQAALLEASRPRMRSWAAQAATLAALALVGFWIGNALIPSSVHAVSAQQTVSSGEAYFNTIIFGPKTWKEVSL